MEVVIEQEKLSGVANLGHAPTLHHNRPPCLEVHLIDICRQLYGQQIEVYFHQFIRTERRFHSSQELKDQISKDIAFAKQIASHPTRKP